MTAVRLETRKHPRPKAITDGHFRR
jgi:hypothetical protein